MYSRVIEYIKKNGNGRRHILDLLILFVKYLRVNQFWINNVTFVYTGVTDTQHFLDNRLG